MTDKLTPGMLRDLRNLLMTNGGWYPFDFLETEAARREAEDKPASAADRIEAQAREIAAANDHLDIAQATCNMQIERADRAEAENARLREALLDARDMVQSWGAYASDYFKDKWDFAGDIAKLNAALARGGDNG